LAPSHFVKSHGQSGTVPVPQPTNDPHDPLNWSPSWKAATIIIGLFFTLIQPFGQTSRRARLCDTYGRIPHHHNTSIGFHRNYRPRSWLRKLPLGPACRELWPSRSLYRIYDRHSRISHLACYCHILSLVSRVVHSRRPRIRTETLFPMIITDVVSFNERGKFVTLYTTALFLSLMLSPVVCSAMAQNVGWRNFFWLIVSLRLRIRQFWSVGTVLWPSLQFQCVASGLQQVRLLFRCDCGPCNRRAIFRLGINMGHETKRWHSGA
jgi:hypothetical protein